MKDNCEYKHDCEAHNIIDTCPCADKLDTSSPVKSVMDDECVNDAPCIIVDFIREHSETIRAALQDAWQPIETMPDNLKKDGPEFYALFDTLPYLCRYDEYGRLVRYNHSNVAKGDAYRKKIINDVEIREMIRIKGEPDYQKQGSLWTLGFDYEPTHWMLKQKPSQGLNDE